MMTTGPLARHVLAVTGASFVVCLTSVGLAPLAEIEEAFATSHAAASVPQANNVPLGIKAHKVRLLRISRDEQERLALIVRPPRDGNVITSSYALHLLRLHGSAVSFEDARFPSGGALLEAICTSEKGAVAFGDAPVVAIRSGWRFPTRPEKPLVADRASEHHRDQTIAALAELGIPLSRRIGPESGSATLRDALNDSIVNFHPHQKELAWTAIAYALYLPPQRVWVNRFGERYGFDDLAERLIHAPLDQESCGGTHLLYAMTILCRADRQAPVLSLETRAALRRRIGRAVDVAVETQAADGSWGPGWNHALIAGGTPRGLSYVDDPVNRLILTGHVAEWLLYLPEDLEVHPRVLTRSAEWLKSRLLAAKPEEVEKDFCSHTHAACVLRHVAYMDEETASVPVAADGRRGGG